MAVRVTVATETEAVVVGAPDEVVPRRKAVAGVIRVAVVQVDPIGPCVVKPAVLHRTILLYLQPVSTGFA